MSTFTYTPVERSPLLDQLDDWILQQIRREKDELDAFLAEAIALAEFDLIDLIFIADHPHLGYRGVASQWTPPEGPETTTTTHGSWRSDDH